MRKIKSNLDYIKYINGDLVFNYSNRKEIIRNRVFSI